MAGLNAGLMKLSMTFRGIDQMPKILEHSMLKDIPNFGKHIPNDANNFRWSTKADCERLQMKLPLTLIKVITKGIEGSVMTAIQLIFRDGSGKI